MFRNRREFLADVGRGVLVAGVGSSLALDLGLSPALAEETPALSFGKLEPLVVLMQGTPADKLLPILVEKINGGMELKELVSAAVLANSRTFGGEDYIGFHTVMALSPCFTMSKEMPPERKALPVLKVLYRNSNRIQAVGGRKNEVLRPVEPKKTDLLEKIHARDVKAADGSLAATAEQSAEDAFNELLPAIFEAPEVHRVVLPYRAWDLLGIVGKEHATTLLRQSVHYCVKAEQPKQREYFAGAREILPKMLDQHKLPGKGLGKREADDAWVEKMSETLFKSTPEDAAGHAAAALAEGFLPDAIAEAVCLAANQLTLRDNGRPKGQTADNKPEGSVHGDSIGVHACDSANAWRNLARAANPRNTAACIIMAAWQVARDRAVRGGDFLKWEPYPRADAPKVKGTDKASLLSEAESAIKNKDQAHATAVVKKYADMGLPAREMFDLLLRYSVSEDGALHAEKYYGTTTQEFATGRKKFQWRQLVALARVVTSAYGYPAPGYAEACKLLKV